VRLKSKVTHLIFDADDTLWENNVYFVKATTRFYSLMEKAGAPRKMVDKDFKEMERKIVAERGYGSENFIYILELLTHIYQKNYPLNIHQAEVNDILNGFNEHLSQKPDLFSKVIPTLTRLAKNYKTYILTKGNNKEQQNKLERSGIEKIVDDFFIVPEKNDDTYASLLSEHNWLPHRTCMVGNSPKSDINPALRSGMFAVYIPYRDTWDLEKEIIEESNKLITLKSFAELPDILL
jgi:putative hydrolase of the HAD superfamily